VVFLRSTRLPTPRPSLVTMTEASRPFLDETANSGPGAFTFDPTLDFFRLGAHLIFQRDADLGLLLDPHPNPSSIHRSSLPQVRHSLIILVHLHLFHTIKADRYPTLRDVKATRENRTAAASFGAVQEFLFCGKTTLRSARSLWSSLPPHLPLSLKCSQRTG